MKMWIARDAGKQGELILYTEKPYTREHGCWECSASCDMLPLDEDYFPEVTFENSPMEVELVIKK